MEELVRISKKRISPGVEEKADKNRTPLRRSALAGKETQQDDLERSSKRLKYFSRGMPFKMQNSFS